jgi:hypothetical protein
MQFANDRPGALVTALGEISSWAGCIAQDPNSGIMELEISAIAGARAGNGPGSAARRTVGR